VRLIIISTLFFLIMQTQCVFAQATPEQVEATVSALLKLYGADCSGEDIKILSEKFNNFFDAKALIKTAFEKKGCDEAKSLERQSRKCYQFLDAELGKIFRKTLKELRLDCKLDHHWIARLAANSCQMNRDMDQLKGDNKKHSELEARGYCTYSAKKCESSSVVDLEKYTFNCTITESSSCLPETQLSACVTSPLGGRAKFSPVIRPAALFGSGTAIDPGAQ